MGFRKEARDLSRKTQEAENKARQLESETRLSKTVAEKERITLESEIQLTELRTDLLKAKKGEGEAGRIVSKQLRFLAPYPHRRLKERRRKIAYL